ncbi:MAG: glycosyltransferase family 1 protein [Candidatus Rokuibacteriota bacterium]|nr:MAG: glycosyltransferase family 1 protein [Candidatus Rokubacteria bacterium]
MSLRVAMLSVHTCPLAALGGKETGGMNVYVRELARELARMRMQADIFTRSQNPTIPRVVTLAEGVRVVHLAAGPQAPMARERVFEHLDEFVDGVEAFRIAAGADYDLIHAHYWLSGAVGLALRRRWAVPLVQMFHTLGRLKNDASHNGADREPDVRIAEEARIVGAADRIVASTVVERAHLVGHYGADPSRIAVIPCGVDTELFTPGAQAAARAALGLGDEPQLLYVGRQTPIKGLETLLDAMARLRAGGTPARLSIVGGDADEPLDGHEAALRERLGRLGLGKAVTFVGAQPQDRLPAWYVAADATVLPSYYESFGMVALEAMACGSPVVASRVGGLQTTVRDRVTGLLVREHDPAALAEALERLLGDEDLRWRLGREGVRWAAQHRWPCVAEAVCREYAALVAAAARHLDSGRCV